MCKKSIKQINDKPKNNENVPPILDIKPNNSGIASHSMHISILDFNLIFS